MGVKQKTKSLKARGSSLSSTFMQLKVLSGREEVKVDIPHFEKRIGEHGLDQGILPSKVDIFQINIGKLCNQT